MSKTILIMPMHGASSKYGGASDHILKWHIVEHTSSIFHAPTLCMHVNQTTSHKNIKLQTTLNNLLMNTHAFFNNIHISTCIQEPHKSDTHPLTTIVKIIPMSFAPSCIAHIPITWWFE
jgi:hypothetical protein